MTEALSRVAPLFFLVLAPRLLSPDPPAATFGFALLGALVLVAGPFTAGYLVRSYAVLESKVALGLWLLADLLLVFAATRTAETGEPLLAGYYLAAPPVWSALAATLATLAGQHLGVSFKNKRMGAAILTLVLFIFIFRDASPYISSTNDQWQSALRADPDHERALSALGGGVSAATLEACAAKNPTACRCRVMRAERALETMRWAAALDDLTHANCDNHPLELHSTAARALALAQLGRSDDASELASRVLATKPNDSRALLAAALTRRQRKDWPAALEFARNAVAEGGGRAATLLLGQLMIEVDDFEGARDVLRRLTEQLPDDADAALSLAIVDDHDGRYSPARDGYLKVLRLRPASADARYRLAVLALRHGFTSEARTHTQKFLDAFPNDPRGTALAARLPP